MVAERSPISRRPIVDYSPISFNDSHAPGLNKRPKGPLIVVLCTMCHLFDGSARTAIFVYWSARTVADVAVTCLRPNRIADLVGARPSTSRQLLCNLAGTDRGHCCDLCGGNCLSESCCSVCMAEAFIWNLAMQTPVDNCLGRPSSAQTNKFPRSLYQYGTLQTRPKFV